MRFQRDGEGRWKRGQGEGGEKKSDSEKGGMKGLMEDLIVWIAMLVRGKTDPGENRQLMNMERRITRLRTIERNIKFQLFMP